MNRNIERIMGMKDSGSGITSSPLIISATKSVNGSVKLHLPHDLADASIHASTTTGKIRLVSNGRTESYTKTFTRSGISAFTIQASTVNGNVLLSDLPAEN